MSENLKKLYKLLAQVLSISEDDINDNLSHENSEKWDSFTGLMLVAELEKTFEVSFAMEEVLEIRSVGAIKEHLIKHGVML